MQMDLSEIITSQLLDNNPPLYEGLMHFWIQIFGIEEWSVRLPSVLFSCGSLAFLFLMLRKHASIQSAIIASLLLIFSNYQLEFAQQARAYSLLGFMSTGAMFFFVEFLVKSKFSSHPGNSWFPVKEQRSSFIGLLIFDTLLMNTHYMGLLILLTQVVVVLSSLDLLKKLWKQMILFSLAFLILWLPILLAVVKRAMVLDGGLNWIGTPDFGTLVYVVILFVNDPNNLKGIFLLAFFFLIKFFLKKELRSSPLEKTLFAWAVFPIGFLWLYSLQSPAFLPRYLMPSSIGLLALAGVASFKLFDNKFLKMGMPALIILGFVITYQFEVYNKRNDRLLVETVKEMLTDKSSVIICPKFYDINFSYYFDRASFQTVDGLSFFDTVDRELQKKNVYSIWHIREFPFEENMDHVVYIDIVSDLTNPGNGILDSLSSRYNLIGQQTIEDFYKVYEFTR